MRLPFLPTVIVMIWILCVQPSLVSAEGEAKSPAPQAISPELTKTLSEVIIPHLEFHDATLDDALKVLNQIASEHIQLKHLHFANWTEAELPKTLLRERPDPKANSTASPSPTAEPLATIRLSLSNIPMIELMRYVSNLFQITPAQNGNTIYLVPVEGTFGPIIEKRYVVPSGFHRNGLDAQRFLQDNGVQFRYEGTGAYFTRDGSHLVVRNTPDQFVIIDSMSGRGCRGAP